MKLSGNAPVFVRDATSGARDKDRAPLPPSAVSSKFAILDDGISLSPEVLSAFLKAGLLRRYDALQMLQSVSATFGEKPAPKPRAAGAAPVTRRRAATARTKVTGWQAVADRQRAARDGRQ